MRFWFESAGRGQAGVFVTASEGQGGAGRRRADDPALSRDSLQHNEHRCGVKQISRGVAFHRYGSVIRNVFLTPTPSRYFLTELKLHCKKYCTIARKIYCVNNLQNSILVRW